METILVTGGCGFVGSHTCTKLIKSNFNVLIIDSLVNSHRDIFPKIKSIFDKNKACISSEIFFLEGDLRDNKWLDKVFDKLIILIKVKLAS